MRTEEKLDKAEKKCLFASGVSIAKKQKNIGYSTSSNALMLLEYGSALIYSRTM